MEYTCTRQLDAAARRYH